jgi:DNA-3-methyladenine glycosylase II
VLVSVVQQGARVQVTSGVRVDPARLQRQVGRLLSLDHDANGLARIGARDTAIGRALAERPGFRPVCFASAYEAAVWGVLAQRTPMRVAARLKHKLAEHTDSLMRAEGEEFALAPRPERLLELGAVAGIPELKLERLRRLAAAALAGVLDTERLRALGRADALAQLSTLPGVGPWTAELIRMRGTGVVDELTATEPRVYEAVGHAYGLGRAASAEELDRLAERWRPYRSWISVLLVSRWMRTKAPLRPSLPARPLRLRAAPAR